MSFLCDLFLIFYLIFIVINHMTSDVFFVYFLEYLLLFLGDKLDEKSE